MSRLQLEYRDSKATFIVKAQLLKRFSHQRGKFRFEESSRSEYRDSNYLVCDLYVSTPFVLESVLDNALARSSQKIICEPGIEISIDGGTLLLALPVEMIISRSSITIEERINLHQTGVINNRHSEASIKKRLAEINELKKSGIKRSTPLEPLIQLWLHAKIQFKDLSKIHVSCNYENFENPKVVSGGRPESNPRKF